jgi:hypothetical protein
MDGGDSRKDPGCFFFKIPGLKALCIYARLNPLPSQIRKSNMSKSSILPTTVAAKSAYIEQLPFALLNAFDTNNRINCYLIEALPREAWTGKPFDGKGRTIAAIVAHMRNRSDGLNIYLRVGWVSVAAPAFYH